MSSEADVQNILVRGVTIPATCAGFRRGRVTNNEPQQLGLGYTIAYHGGQLGKGTVYIYNKGMGYIPEGPHSQLVCEELDQTTRDVLSMQQYAPKKRITLVKRYGTGSPERGLEFLCAEFILSDAAGSRRTFAYLTSAKKHFVKVRITLLTNDATDPTARNFADTFASRLWSG